MLASLNVHGEVAKTVVAEGVKAGQCPGVSVALQTDRTSQLLLQLLESLTGGGGFLCHWVTAIGVSTNKMVAELLQYRCRRIDGPPGRMDPRSFHPRTEGPPVLLS